MGEIWCPTLGVSYLYRSLRSPSVLLSYYLIILLSYYLIILLFNYLGRRKRTLHLYVVTATNLSFRLRANVETSHSVRYDLVVDRKSVV